jgi:hypothetical protein
LNPESYNPDNSERLSGSTASNVALVPDEGVKGKGAIIDQKMAFWKFYFQTGVLLFILASIFFLWSAAGRVLEFGPDEGMEFSKIQLLLQHPEMAKLAWNDQSWFYSQVFASVFKSTGFQCGVPRLATLLTTICLMISFPRFMPKGAGWLHVICAWLFFWCWPEMPHLAVSAMLEMPAIGFAIVAVAILPRDRTEWRWWRFCCAGAIFAVAIQIKLTALIVVPALAIKLGWLWWWEVRCEQPAGTLADSIAKIRWLFPPAVGCVAFAMLFVLIAWWSPTWDWSQLWGSHLAADSTGEAAKYHLEPQYLLQSPGILAAAVLATITLWRKRRVYEGIFTLVLLVTVFIIHFYHRPWWYYYGLHFAIPLAILGGWGAAELIRDGVQRRSELPLTAKSGFTPEISMILGAVSISLFGGFELPRGYDDTLLVGQAERIADNDTVNELKKYKMRVKWAFSDHPIVIAQAGYIMPPELTVLAKKRLWTGNITDETILETVKRYQCEVLVLYSNRQLKEKSWNELVQNEYVNTWAEHNEYVFVKKRLNPSPEVKKGDLLKSLGL